METFPYRCASLDVRVAAFVVSGTLLYVVGPCPKLGALLYSGFEDAGGVLLV